MLAQKLNCQVQHNISSKELRIPALDFTKGTLVVFMVLYHWINYFIGPEWAHYRYLRFLSPSFIFITGFMISNVYLMKYGVTDRRLVKRLLNRAMKLLVMFIVINQVRNLLLIDSYSSAVLSAMDSSNLFVTFVTGNFTSKVVSFYILVPISYLLVLSALLIVPLRSWKYTFHATCGCLLAIILLLYANGCKSPLLEIIAIGTLGILAGFYPTDVMKNAICQYIVVISYILYVTAITIYDVTYPLEMIGTCLSVMALYSIGIAYSGSKWIKDELMLLGRYSLFGYISQIVILQVLERSLRSAHLRTAALMISFSAALGLTVVAVRAIHEARLRVTHVDKVYRVLFN